MSKDEYGNEIKKVIFFYYYPLHEELDNKKGVSKIKMIMQN